MSRTLDRMPFSLKRCGSVAYSMVMFVIVSVLAGVLIAGLFVPFAGFAGVSSKAAATELDRLPAELATPIPSTRSKVLMGDGKVLAYFYDENRVTVPLSGIAPVMRKAQLAIEDHRFYEHGALDFTGTLRAFLRNSAGGATQGGSSISQQYVKMVQVEACQTKPADEAALCTATAQASTVERKVRELRYAIALEKRLSKDEILERYLNIAYYGDGAYGVESAARHYFSTTAAKLTLPQAAMLAGLVQNPDANNPIRNKSAAIDRRDVVINRMAELKLITKDQGAAAKKSDFDKSLGTPTRNGCVGTTFPFLCDYVRRTLLNNPSLGKSVTERENLLKRGGLTIQTAIDPKTQKIAQKAVNRIVGPTDPVISTMNIVEPGTGLIVAMAQSRPSMGNDKSKGQTYFNYSVEQSMGGAEGYQAGSTFKAFTAAAAMERGIPISKKYDAKSPMDFSNKKFSTCNGTTRDPDYKPKNSTGVNGVMDMQKAANSSVNTYFLQLERTVGICPVSKMAEKAGVQLSDPGLSMTKSNLIQVASFTLGVANVTPLSMAEAYSTFAARGVHCDPIVVSKITTRDGKDLPAPSANCKRVMSKAVADGMNRLLGGVIKDGTGRRARIPNARSQAGKTGTTNDRQAVWFIGYTPALAASTMIAVDPTRKPFRQGPGRRAKGLQNYTIPSTDFTLEGSGSGDPGQEIWKPVMTAAMKGRVDRTFAKPPSSIIEGRKVQVPMLFGLSAGAGTKRLEAEGFSVITRYVYSTSFDAGRWMGFSPSSGATVQEFGTIYSEYSKGEDPAIAREEQARREAAKRAADAAEEAANRREQAAQERQDAADERAAEAQKKEEDAKKKEEAAKKKEADAKKKEEAAKKKEADAKKKGGG